MSTGDLQGLYQQVILDHAREKHGFGLGNGQAPDTASHQVNPTCGDEITLHLHLEPGDGSIGSVRWEGQGCSISQASASLLADLAPGIDVPGMRQRIDAFRLAMRSKGTIEPDEDLLGDAVVLGGTSKYIARVKCAMLAWVALEDALLKLPAAP
ncbi:Fe-S cluster assembly sulfur transfer protein SufU [Subtercola boreus]|uniref:SUF system NifU family Fe-S cluster assembly protein n=1 Tax=Subtercola boreus TaxID=120213 RepID=A0A3E0W9I0_9MICO|nr:SUF system NifU family Fe-S cluster assembly protein [Subtercola boreus]RFA19034.1 SUF system NifU family Fe-S cluster assembly protein [Subtercola boreus]RFA19172.1 SUF system NifU family Fe-S cluster assembly protein [Subtercola boreus]RFA25634.1 SUF system NifU family Fe-S cluster assembly protein [Subtercola boreus]